MFSYVRLSAFIVPCAGKLSTYNVNHRIIIVPVLYDEQHVEGTWERSAENKIWTEWRSSGVV